MSTSLHMFYSCSSLTSSPLTVSLAPLASQFCWTVLALSPSPSSAPAELCPPHLPSSRHHSRPWTPHPQRSPSRSWRTNCCSLNRTLHLKIDTNGNCSADFFLISISSTKPKQTLILYFTPLRSVYITFWHLLQDFMYYFWQWDMNFKKLTRGWNFTDVKLFINWKVKAVSQLLAMVTMTKFHVVVKTAFFQHD